MTEPKEPPADQHTDLRTCPACGKPIKRRARLCKHCHAQVLPELNGNNSTIADPNSLALRQRPIADESRKKPDSNKQTVACWTHESIFSANQYQDSNGVYDQRLNQIEEFYNAQLKDPLEKLGDANFEWQQARTDIQQAEADNTLAIGAAVISLLSGKKGFAVGAAGASALNIEDKRRKAEKAKEKCIYLYNKVKPSVAAYYHDIAELEQEFGLPSSKRSSWVIPEFEQNELAPYERPNQTKVRAAHFVDDRQSAKLGAIWFVVLIGCVGIFAAITYMSTSADNSARQAQSGDSGASQKSPTVAGSRAAPNINASQNHNWTKQSGLEHWLNGKNSLPDMSAETASITQMLKATAEGDEDLFCRAQADLAGLLKPFPGESAEATRLNKLGLKNLKSKNYSKAASFFSAASKADPSDPKLLSNLGYAKMFAGDLTLAARHLYQSIALDPSRPVAWGDLGLVYAKQGQQDDAVNSLLIGYRLSNGDTLGFLKSLQSDDDPAVRTAGNRALSKIQAGSQSQFLVSSGSSPMPTMNYSSTGRVASPVDPESRPKVDFSKYIPDLERRIKRAWFPPKADQAKRVVVLFKIDKDGAMSNLRIQESSGSQTADQAAMKAVENAAPFRPLPLGTPDDGTDIQFSFDYNLSGRPADSRSNEAHNIDTSRL